MSNILEERLLSYIQENMVDGRLLIKLNDLAVAIGETRNPVYRALRSLAKKRKIRTENRSKLGIEITLLNKTPNSSQTEEKNNILPLEELTSQIRLLNLQQLKIIRDVVDMEIARKSRELK